MNDATPPTTQLDEQDHRLRRTFERQTLERLTDALREPELTPECLCKLVHAYAEIKKHDVDHEKNRVLLEVARVKASKPPRPTAQDGDAQPIEPHAPYGLKPDGTPYTQTEFNNALSAAVSDIYGISLPDENTPPAPPGGHHTAPASHSDLNLGPADTPQAAVPRPRMRIREPKVRRCRDSTDVSSNEPAGRSVQTKTCCATPLPAAAIKAAPSV
jgi:hypothetical protein